MIHLKFNSQEKTPAMEAEGIGVREGIVSEGAEFSQFHLAFVFRPYLRLD